MKMSNKSKKSKGISLIVLVVTILVLSILAATVIISLSNTNVIVEATNAKNASDIANMKEAANLIYANAYLAGFIIIFIDLIILSRYLNTALKQASVAGFVLQSIIRWVFIGVCIYVALVRLHLYKWSFALGIILPFVGVFITGIYQIFRGKEDGTSS